VQKRWGYSQLRKQLAIVGRAASNFYSNSKKIRLLTDPANSSRRRRDEFPLSCTPKQHKPNPKKVGVQALACFFKEEIELTPAIQFTVDRSAPNFYYDY